ncbi:MAG: hypothetical protein HC852_23985 [Acaryochloridaceae cyanobacterium RU_4_10]|nr:hypothetical protein [Acaryochloridaceae cyanobacterium RU_4_10]
MRRNKKEKPVEGFMALLEMYLVKLGVVHASLVLLVADGAPWIWQRMPVLLKRLGLCPQKIIELIDFYHASPRSSHSRWALPFPFACRIWISVNMGASLF